MHIFINDRGRSSTWLEYWIVDPGVAGSSPVGPEFIGLFQRMKVKKDYLKLLSEKLLDLGNLSLVSLTFVSLFSKDNQLVGFLTGLILFVFFFFISFLIGGKLK